MLAYWGKKRKLVKIQRIENGVVYAYSIVGESEGSWYFPLVENGKNVEKFKLAESEQLSLWNQEDNNGRNI